MNAPAEKDTETDEPLEEAAAEEAVKPQDIPEPPPVQMQPRLIEGGLGKTPPHIPLYQQVLQLPLLRGDIFLGILILTVLNAFIYFYYATTQQTTLDLKAANQILRETLSRNADFLSPTSDFINIHGEFSSTESSEFETSLARFRSRLIKLGVESSDVFFIDEFIQKNGGLYWSKKSSRAPTMYQPITP